MKFGLPLSLVLAATSSLVFAAPTHPSPAHRETLEEAAVNVRKLLHEVTTGTMGSVFPAGSTNGNEDAPCHSPTSLSFITFPISQTAHNIISDPMHHATYTIQMPVVRGVSEFGRARVAFIGNLTLLHDVSEEEDTRLATCFTQYHPDAKWWLPNDPDGAHTSYWSRLDIHDIYYVGGFGSTHYVGHIPVELFANTAEEPQSSTQWIAA